MYFLVLFLILNGLDITHTKDMDSSYTIPYQPRILLVDDHTMILESLQELLKNQYHIVATCSQGHLVIQEVSRLKPDCLLLDISMGEASGFDIARQLKQ